jgi:hypothetical protein
MFRRVNGQLGLNAVESTAAVMKRNVQNVRGTGLHYLSRRFIYLSFLPCYETGDKELVTLSLRPPSPPRHADIITSTHC